MIEMNETSAVASRILSEFYKFTGIDLSGSASALLNSTIMEDIQAFTESKVAAMKQRIRAGVTDANNLLERLNGQDAVGKLIAKPHHVKPKTPAEIKTYIVDALNGQSSPSPSMADNTSHDIAAVGSSVSGTEAYIASNFSGLSLMLGPQFSVAALSTGSFFNYINPLMSQREVTNTVRNLKQDPKTALETYNQAKLDEDDGFISKLKKGWASFGTWADNFIKGDKSSPESTPDAVKKHIKAHGSLLNY